MIVKPKMKLEEITIYPSREDPIENYQHLFDNAKRESAFDNLEFSEVFSTDDHYLGLFHNNELVSLLLVSFRQLNKWQITYSQTILKFRGQGCFRYLLHKALDIHKEILSDDHQTPEAELAWKALIKYTDERMIIVVFDEVSKQEYSKNKIPFDKIWNENENFLLLAKKRIFTQKMLENRAKDNELKKKVNRDYDSIWYGQKSSNKDYVNP